MISIDNKKIDLVFQVEEYASVNDIIKELSLEIDNILVICPELFIQRFVHAMHDNIAVYNLDSLESDLNSSMKYTGVNILYKGKHFAIDFIILSTETKVINTPLGDKQDYKVGFNKINI